MIDLVIKTSVVALVAVCLTRRNRPETAADDHRVWLVVLFSPLLILAANAVLPPFALVLPRGPAVPAPPPGWTSLLYALVASALLIRVGAGLWTVGALSRRARRLPEPDLARLRALAGVSRLHIREAELTVPVTAGVLRPCVILPRGWRRFGEASLSAILRHEAAHVRRRDCSLALIAALIEAVFWFCPAVWLASRRVRWFAEMTCDAEAARRMGPGRYAGELLELAAGWAGAPSPRYAITAGAETQVARRIRLLLDATTMDRRRRALFPVVLVVMALALPASALVRFSGSRVAPPAMASDHAGLHRHPH